MAVSGLEQRNAPLVLVSSVWSPWGPYMVAPNALEECDETPAKTEKVLHRRPKPIPRSRTWSGYTTHAQVAGAPANTYGTYEAPRGRQTSDPRTKSFCAEEEYESSGRSTRLESPCDQTGPTSPSMEYADSLTGSSSDVEKPVMDPYHQYCYSAPQIRSVDPPSVANSQNLTHMYMEDNEAKMDQIGASPTWACAKENQAMPENKRKPRRKSNKSKVPSNPINMNNDPQMAVGAESQQEITTLVIRNLPRSLTHIELVQAMEASGYAGTWDFCYLPYKFQVRKNFGFAFVNFVTAEMAQKFVRSWHQTRPFSFGRVRKPVNVAAATVQGRQANEIKAQNLMEQVKNPAYQPVLLESQDW